MPFVTDPTTGRVTLTDTAGKALFSFNTDGTIGVHNGNAVPDGKIRINAQTKALEAHDGTAFRPVQAASVNKGIGTAVTAAATTKNITFTTPETDANYQVNVSPAWVTHYSVTAKTVSGCTITFGNAAPGGGSTFDYQVHR